MPVDGARALQEFLEPLAADDELGDQADRRPHRVAAAHPVPHREAMLGRDAEGIHGCGIGRHRHEMIGRAPSRPSAPTIQARAALAFACVSCVMKVFEHTMTKRLRRIDAADQILELRAIHVRDEVRRDAAAPFSLRSASHTSSGPRSDPPMPIFTTCLNFLPRHPALLAPRAPRRRSSIVSGATRGLRLGWPPSRQTPSAARCAGPRAARWC